MTFPSEMDTRQRRRLALLAFLLLAGVAAVAAMFAVLVLHGKGAASAQTVREYNLEIVNTDIDYGNGNVWHAWTFKNADDPSGTVPGPTLEVTVGEKLIVHVTNKTNLTHSFHTHLTNYDEANDGSQLNIITGNHPEAMIAPGGTYTYEFEPDKAGTFFYHCHSADGGHHITDHIHQGLYGVIIVRSKDQPKPKNEMVIVMGEMGFDTVGDSVPPYIMNGMGIPGGEHALETIFEAQGINGVAAQFNKTLPVLNAQVGEQVTLHLLNIGDLVHTFHAHGVELYSQEVLNGDAWPANTVPLDPGTVDTVTFTYTNPGIWLFHCHIVAHADAGMIGLFNITDATQTTQQPPGGQ
jgi:FtsP/CotA-like multicopper oxidase with cupredoxin domain